MASHSRSKHAASYGSSLERLEQRRLMAGAQPPPPPVPVRSYDGSGNNIANPAWGEAGTALLRLAAAAYPDGIGTPTGSDRPSARAISNAIDAHPADTDILSATHLSAFSYLWGQFVDHDLDLTSAGAAAEEFDVAVPTGDPYFDPNSTGTQVIPLTRSEYAAGTGVTTARQQVNDITSYLDGSMIYGSDATRAAALRSFVGGRLKTSDGDLLPFNTAGFANANDAHIFADDQLFLAGDVRANENSELTALQTLFMREHNRLAAQIQTQHANWTDEQIYQQARGLVIGEVQQITYNEFLPALLGTNALPRYTGYDPKVNAGVTNEFSTAAYRLGHSMLVDDVEFKNDDGTDAQPDMSLAQVFFNPTVVEGSGIDTIMKYLASSNSEEIDTKIVDSLRNFLFGAPGEGGLDLASLNIQRGRDHGLADYNTTRAAVGLPRVTSFSQISSDTTLAANLQAIYGSVDNIDLWVGGLAEDHVAGSNLGATFQKIIVDQFTRTRAGDRFWYERDLSGSELAMVHSMTLEKVVAANTSMSNMQSNVFVFNTTATGRVWNDFNGNGRADGGIEKGLPNISLSLRDSDGNLVATTTTDNNGNYSFSGIQLGDYTVTPTLTKGSVETTAASSTINVSRGETFASLNFGFATVRGPIALPPKTPPTQLDPRTKDPLDSLL